MSAKTSDWRPGPTVCRCCLSEGCYKDISTEYFWMGKREVYAEMLSDTLDLSIAYSKSGPNSNSRLICEPCISRLRDAHDFKRQVLECEKTFMQHLDPGSESVQKEMELSFEEVKLERVKQEKKVSDDEDMDDQVDFVVNDDSDDDLDNEPLMKLATKVPKKEKEVDLLDLLDSSQITVKRKSTASTSKAKEPPAKKAKKREITIKPSASKATASKAVEKKKKGTFTNSTPHSAHIDSEDVRDNAAIMLECSNMCPFKFFNNTFRCAYCPHKSPDFDPIRSHAKEHTIKATALKKIPRNSVCKADVTELKCELCKESMLDISTLFDHLIKSHNKPLNTKLGPGIVPYLLNDKFACASCGLVFDRFHNLNIHVNEHYPNSVCSECGQSYISEQRLKRHMLNTHSKTTNEFSCTKCDKKFSSNHQRHMHLTTEHNIDRYKCPYCVETFYDYTHRVAHLNEVHDKKIEYPCKTCPKIFTSSSARASHMRNTHVKNKKFACPVCAAMFVRSDVLKRHMVKHSGEKNHKCHLCNKSYGRKSSLQEHMRIHNNDRRFVCVYCGEAFVQKCSLKSHMKTHHSDGKFIGQLDKAASGSRSNGKHVNEISQ